MKVQKDQKNVNQKNKVEKKENQLREQKATKAEDSDEEYYAIEPPNGGWGWLVVLSALYCNIVVDGIQLTFGIFLKPISTSFDSTSSEVSLAGSLMFGVHLLIGPLCAGCNNVFGLRPVTITGSLICCFGVGISYFSNGYIFLCFSFGLIGGLGLGMVYMNTLVITSLYFTSMLPIAVGVVVCGSGIGTMIFAGLGTVLLRITTWRNSFLMEAALAGSMGLAAIVFRPLKPIKVKLTPSTSKHVEEKAAGPSFQKRNSVFIKTEISSRASYSSIITLQDLAWNFAQTLAVKDLEEENKRRCVCSNCCRTKHKSEENEIYIRLHEIKNQEMNARRESYMIEDTEANSNDKERTRTEKKQKSTSRRKSVYTRIDLKSRKTKDKICAPLKQTLMTMLDCSLLRSFSFFLFTISGAIHVAALLIVFIYEKDRTEDLGFAEDMSTIFLIALGAANVLWRLVLGILAAFVKVNYKLLLVLGIVAGGVATMCSGFISNVIFEFIFCIFFSLAMAIGAVFRVVLLVDLVGTENVATATGINLTFMGAFCIISPPLFGLIMEAANSYQVLFSITGGLIIISGLLLIGVNKVVIKEKKKKEKEKKEKKEKKKRAVAES